MTDALKNQSLKRQFKLFELLCCLVYFTSYITRINLGAVVAEIVEAEGYAKSAISVVVFMAFISYGVGQLLSGYLGDRFQPHKLILIGFLSTCSCNILIPFCGGIPSMSAVWFVNGLAQAMMWPPLVKLMSQYLTDKDYTRVCANVSAASSVGTIFVYLAAPVFIRLGSWRYVFYFCAAVGFLVAALWAFLLPRTTAQLPRVEQTRPKESTACTASVWGLFKKFGLIFICIAIILQGAIRDGINTWLPSSITEIFHMEAAASILMSVVLPIFSIASFKVFAYIQGKYVKNEASHAALLFSLCMVLALIWMATFSVNVVLSLLLSSLIIGLIHGINLMLIGILPKRFISTGKVSFISGLLNFFTYVGSAISTYGMARISEVFGWQATIFAWALLAAGGLLMCALCIGKFKKA